MARDMDIEDMEWLVRSRSEVQKLLLLLFNIAKEEPPLSSLLKLQIQLLIAVCFALWRAVFLAHGNRSFSTIDSDALKFLEILVRDNAIGYVQDRDSKGWTFGYYVNDAYFRLEYYDKKFRKLKPPHSTRVTAYLDAQSNAQSAGSNSHVAWTHAYEAAVDAAKALTKAIAGTA